MSISIFVAGDLHIPSRAVMLHPKFQLILEQQKWDYIVLTGDLTTQKALQQFTLHVKKPENIIACQGNMDSFVLPEKPVFEINGLKLGVYHGMGISPRGNISQLKKLADEMNVRVLFTGHSHQQLIHIDNDHIILNPGTSTGASGGTSWSVDTGIILLAIDKKEINIESLLLSHNQRLRKKKWKKLL